MDNEPEVEKVCVTTRVKLPKFWPQKINLWFHRVEAQFQLSKIVRDETKFTHIVCELDDKYLEEVEDIVKNPPEVNKYETIKSALIKRLTDSDATRTRKLLETEEIGDRTPSQYWRHLKQLAGDSVTEQFLIDLWKSRLPTKTQEILSVTEDKKCEKLTAIADRIHDVSVENPRIAVVTEPQADQLKALLEKVESLQLQISAIATNSNSRSRNRSRARTHGDRRDRSQPKKHDLCWYHFKFGEKATQCRQPCNYEKPKN